MGTAAGMRGVVVVVVVLGTRALLVG